MSRPRTRIFTGPTLSADATRTIIEADVRPPVTVDDLAAAVDDGVRVIGIIDGAFVQRYSATPTQILDCLRQGIVIYGAASAGALRAVEAAPFGMRGVGDIYRLFASGYRHEDELMMAYHPETLAPLSVAMINVRFAVANAVRSGVLTPDEGQVLQEVAKSQYFPSRTYRSICRQAAEDVGDTTAEAFSAFVERHGASLDLKRRDAIACLRRMRDDVAAGA